MKLMNKLLFLFLIIFLASCKINETDTTDYSELFELTDKYVDKLYFSSASFGILTPNEDSSSGYYTIIPVGRLICVKITTYVDDSVYNDLISALSSHYSGNKTVKDVYRNNGGTVTIDCRN